MQNPAQERQIVWGPGTYTDTEFIPVPQDSQRLLHYFSSITPGFTRDPAILQSVKFHRSDLPCLPGSIKAQVMSAVIHGMIGVAANEISALKGIDAGTISINTDHAGLYNGTVGLPSIGRRDFLQLVKDRVERKVGVDVERGVLDATPMLPRTGAIYPTKDPEVWFQLVGTMVPTLTLETFGLAHNAASSLFDAYEKIKAATTRYSGRELEQICLEHGLCGQTRLTPQQPSSNSIQHAAARQPTPRRHEIVELTRVIAGPCLGSLLASLGAEVVRVQPPHLHDCQVLNLTLTAGKRTTGLNLNKSEDHQHLESLIAEADVFIQAFRLRSLEHRGFGLGHILEIANNRGKGIVYLDLNCSGPDGYYAERPGFRQIADAATGCSYIYGQAYGPGGVVPVLPSLPVSDMLTGAVGVVDILLALRDRALYGGSYHTSVALVSVGTAQLEPEVGLYNPEIVKRIEDTYRFTPITPDLTVAEVMVKTVKAWQESSDLLERDEFFVEFDETPFGNGHRILAPVVRFDNRAVTPRWTTGPVPYCCQEYAMFGGDYP